MIFRFALNRGSQVLKELGRISEGDGRVLVMAVEKLRNENEDKTMTQMTQSFNQYSENETKIWRQNILNQFNRVSLVLSLFSFRNLSLVPQLSKCLKFEGVWGVLTDQMI